MKRRKARQGRRTSSRPAFILTFQRLDSSTYEVMARNMECYTSLLNPKH